MFVALLFPLGCGSSGGQAPEVELPEPTLRRLTESQYIHAIEDLFGADLFVPTGIEPDLRARGLFSVGASLSSISPRGVEGFERAGYIIAAQVMEPERRERVIACTPSGTVDADCARASLSPLARRAWRRSVAEAELEPLVEIASSAAETSICTQLTSFRSVEQFIIGNGIPEKEAEP